MESGSRDESGGPGGMDGRRPPLIERGWFAGARAFVHRWPGGHHVWRVGIAVLGLVVVAAGIVMLVLPGPGWVVIFLGIGIWATEFVWARSLLDLVRRSLRRSAGWFGRQPRWAWAAGVAACVVLVGAAVLVVLL